MDAYQQQQQFVKAFRSRVNNGWDPANQRAGKGSYLRPMAMRPCNTDDKGASPDAATGRAAKPAGAPPHPVAAGALSTANRRVLRTTAFVQLLLLRR